MGTMKTKTQFSTTDQEVFMSYSSTHSFVTAEFMAEVTADYRAYSANNPGYTFDFDEWVQDAIEAELDALEQDAIEGSEYAQDYLSTHVW